MSGLTPGKGGKTADGNIEHAVDRKGKGTADAGRGQDATDGAATFTGRPMTNRRMFFRMLFSAVFERRSRAMMAVVASLVGAATLFCLAAICVAVPQQMNEQMRSYGANLIITPTHRTTHGQKADGSAKHGDHGDDGEAGHISDMDHKGQSDQSDSGSGFGAKAVGELDEVVTGAGMEHSATYRYENTRINSLPFVVAGINPRDVKVLNHHWSVEGEWPSEGGVILGRDAATKLDAKIGSTITIKYSPAKSVSGQTDESDGSGDSESGDDGAMSDCCKNKGAEGSTGHHETDGGSADGMGNGSSQSSDGHSSGHDMSNMKGMDMSGSMNHDGKQGSGGSDGGKDNLGDALDSMSSMKDGHQMSGMKMSTTTSGSVHLAEWKPTAPNAGGMEFRVDGIVDTGGSEDDMVYAINQDVAKLTGFQRGADVVEFSVDATDDGLSDLVKRINANTSLGAKAQKVTKMTASNVRIITMLQTLFWIVSVVVLVLTLVGVGTTISSIVSQRRNEIGLRKALGAPSRDIAVEFTAEAALYGLIGGVVGTVIGYVLANALSSSVFGQNLAMNWPLALASVLVSTLVAVLASLLPVRHATRIDPAVVLREE
ncbi:putative ABC transport system permease protein [Bifidobacterium commune]|uniref:Putative ABC transport system permease protein n=2 Tax=Bifidobacterium commune TaxID=1505727 RepID=A0A1C4H5W9_9BIFI|nr:putative ABC transport system permease protein [Bifidobacterium commune]SCC80162.1 putative ABC transport system permease protein [Bifidobacterium commune]